MTHPMSNVADKPDFDALILDAPEPEPVTQLDMRVRMICENWNDVGEDRYVRLRQKVQIAVAEGSGSMRAQRAERVGPTKRGTQCVTLHHSF